MAASASSSSTDLSIPKGYSISKPQDPDWFSRAVELFKPFVPPYPDFPSEQQWYQQVNAVHLAMPVRTKRRNLSEGAVGRLHKRAFEVRHWPHQALDTLVNSQIFKRVAVGRSSESSRDLLKKVRDRVLAPRLRELKAERLLEYTPAVSWLVNQLIAERGVENMRCIIDEMDLVLSLAPDDGKQVWELRQYLQPLLIDLSTKELKAFHACVLGFDVPLEPETEKVFNSLMGWVESAAAIEVKTNCPDPKTRKRLKAEVEIVHLKAISAYLEGYLKKIEPEYQPPLIETYASGSDSDCSIM